MAYLGNDLQVAFPVYRNIDDISGSFNSSLKTFPLTVSGVAPVPAPLYSQQCLISVGGVVQRPDDTGLEGFRLSGGNIIFASAPTTGADFFGVILAGADYINAGGNFPSGTAAVPSITFNDDLDTGIYNSGINQVSITTGGSERLRIDSAGQIESVSLGTAAAPAFSFTTDPNSGIYSPGADQVAISTNGTGRLFVNASGNVGVNTASPQRALHLVGSDGPVASFPTIGAKDYLVVENNSNANISIVGGATSGSSLKFFASGNNSPFSTITSDYNNGNLALLSNSSVTLSTASSERLRITSAGLVGIGTSSPSEILDCKGNIVLGAQNAAGASLQPTSASGTDIAGSALILRSGRSTGSGSSGLIQILPSAGSTVSGTTVRNNSDSGFHMKYSPSGWNDHAVLGLLTVALGSSIDEANRSGLTGDATVFTIDGCDTSSQSALEIIATNNGTDGTQGFIRFFGSGSKNPYATIAAVTPGVNYTSGNLAIRTYNAGVEGTVATFTNTGRLGIGTTTVNAKLEVAGGNIRLDNNQGVEWGGSNNYIYGNETTDFVAIATNGNERCRLDSSGRLLVGTSSLTSTYFTNISSSFQIQATGNYTGANIIANNNNNIYGSYLTLGKSRGATTGSFTIVSNGDSLGGISFEGADGSAYKGAALIECSVDGTPGANDMPGRLVFSTTADGASSPTERMRILSSGKFYLNTTNGSTPTVANTSFLDFGGASDTYGVYLQSHSATTAYLNRQADDGAIIDFRQAGVGEGSVTVSGTTVSYNGAHLSRWSQIPGIEPHDKDQRPEILRGTVMSNLNEMCDWVDPESGEAQDNEQLNKTKVSDVEGDKNVAGVFQGWDDDDDTWVNDYYLAVTGDFIIRIGAGVTVERGDLLMSAGDGTAKPQDDDIIRSKTIAKVTSTNVSCTYDDGSYCVPCVLMAC